MAESGTYDQATILRRQKIAEAMLGDAMKPRKIEHWAQGLAQMGQAGIGGYLSNQANEEAKASRAADMASLAALLGGGSAAPSRPAETSSEILPAPAPQTSFPGATEIQTGSGGQKIPIYGKSDDPVPSPLDPPSGQDRTRMIATILGESANQPAAGQNAVASVIRNRAVAGNYGGRSPSDVVTARNQFEPWNTEGGRNKMAAMAADPALAAKADQAIAMAYGEGGAAPNDPTSGAKNFIEPRLQTALGRPMPAWAQGPGKMIGDHKFIGGAPEQAPYDVAGPPTAPPQAPVAQAMAPPQMPPGGGGLLANATPQQRAAIHAGMNASEGSPARAIAMSMMTSLAKPQDYDIHHRPDGSIVAVNKKNPSEVRTIAGDSKGMVDFEANRAGAVERAKREGSVEYEANKAGAVEKAKALATREVAKPEQDKRDQKVADIVTQDIDRAIKTIDSATLPTTGATGNLVSSVGGTAAHDLSKLLDTVKSNAGFQELSKMRQASPTGAALGSVTERELALLQSTIGNLEQSQSEGQLKDNLRRVKNTYMDIIHGEGKGPEREKLAFQEKATPKGIDPGALEEARRRGLIK